MTPEQEERLVGAVERMCGAMASLAKTFELDYNRKYPPKKIPTDVTITYVKSPEEELLENQGNTGEETLSAWTSLGPRELAYVENEEAAKRKTTANALDHSKQTRN